MIHPLDGARLKVVRAQEHFETFKAEAAAFLNAKPYRFESEVYGEHWWVKPKLTRTPPASMSAVLGDCITNLRAPLDYIIWELAQKYFTRQVDLTRQADRQIIAFPILLADRARRQGHLDHLDRLARRGMPTDSIEIIKSVQADASGDASLQWLYELVNTDKHRTPVLAVGSFSGAQIEISNYRGHNWLIRSDIIKDGVTINADAETLAFVRDNPMHVNVQAAVAITARNVLVPNVPLERTLGQIIETVANLIPRFDRFL